MKRFIILSFIFAFLASSLYSKSFIVNEYKSNVYFANGINTNFNKVSSDNNNSNRDSKDNNISTIKSLKLEITNTTLNKDENTTINLKAIYKDGTTKTPNNIEWLINPKDAVRIKGNTLTALKDTNVTIQAKVGNILSNKVKLNIYWEVDGHRLPPEPDPKVNNATLLGVDVNHNGVRDDVERWIYDRYKNKHPIHIDIAMQAARGYRLVLEHPERAKEIREKVNGALICGWYYQHEAEEFGDDILVHERIDSPVFGRYFNTKQRKDVYQQYDILLSGDSYDIPWADEMKKFCDFNTSKYTRSKR